MQHLEVSGAVRPLKSSLGVKGLMESNFRLAKCVSVFNVYVTRYKIPFS